MESDELRIGDPAPEVALPNQDGQEASFSSFWHERPTAFVFLRHFG